MERYVGAQDKEWDAYAGNHATTVFKSLQWKIEKLEAEYSNLKTLLIHFAQLENKLDRLLESLDGKVAPESAAELRAIRRTAVPHPVRRFRKALPRQQRGNRSPVGTIPPPVPRMQRNTGYRLRPRRIPGLAETQPPAAWASTFPIPCWRKRAPAGWTVSRPMPCNF